MQMDSRRVFTVDDNRLKMGGFFKKIILENKDSVSSKQAVEKACKDCKDMKFLIRQKNIESNFDKATKKYLGTFRDSKE
jgi:hypothetical protein